METDATSVAEVEANLQRVLQSPRFASSPTLRSFLTYVVEQKLAGKEADLKAYSIAVDALGKPENFDPQNDPTVRVLAGRLRNALVEYYANEGKNDRVKIAIPTGGYRPDFNSTETIADPGLAPKPADNQQATEQNSKPLLLAVVLGITAIALGWFGYSMLGKSNGPIPKNAIAVLIQTNASLSPDEPTKKHTERLLRQLGAALSRNESLAVNYPKANDSGTQSVSGASNQLDFSITGLLSTAGPGKNILIELSNSKTGSLVWARTYALGEANDQSLSDAMTTRIIQELHTQIFGASIKALEGRDPKTLSAQQLFVLATWIPGPAKNTLEWEKERIRLARLAINKSPKFGPAYSVLADKLAYLAAVDGPSNTEAALKEASTSRLRALEFAPGDSRVMFNVAQSYWHSGNVNDAASSMKRVLELDPNHGLARFFSTVIPYTCKKAPDDVLASAVAFDKSLNSDNPVRWVTLTWQGWLHLNRDEYQLALDAEKRAAQIFQIPYTVMRYATVLNILDRPKEAVELIRSQRENWPNIDPAHFSEVTIPRLCKDFPGLRKMPGFYQNLTWSIKDRLNE